MSVEHTVSQKIDSDNNSAAEKQDNSGCEDGYALSKHRAFIVDALNKSTEIFTLYNEETFDDVMTKGIQPLADAVGLDRVVFYMVEERDGFKRLGQVYRWDKSEGGLMSLADELRVLPDVPVIENWLKIASQGGSIRLKQSEYSKDEAELLGNYGVKSILILPIITQKIFWGVINFQDHTNDRYFDEDCADLLFTAARIFSSAIIKMQAEQKAEKAIKALKRRERMANSLNTAAVMFLSQSENSFEDTMTAGIREIADTFNLDRFSIWRNFTVLEPQLHSADDNGQDEIYPYDTVHVSQIYRWDRESGGTTMNTKMLNDVTYAKLAPRWEKLLASGETINSPARLLPEAALLKSFGVISAFITPLFINNNFWGFALLEDRHIERFFEEDSVEMMRSAAFLCANTVIRADMEREIAYANEFTRAALDASPLNLTVFNENGRVIDCNDAVLKAFKTTKKYFLEHFLELSPEYQSDGSKSGDKAVELIKLTLQGERLVFEWTHCDTTGEPLPYEITLTRTMYNGKYVALGYQYDLRNTKKMTENIREQSKLLKIRLEQQELISEISRGFISSGDSQTLVNEAIAKLGNYLNVSLVFIFAFNQQRTETKLAYHWVANNTKPLLADFDLTDFLITNFPETLPDCSTMPVISCEDTSSIQDEIFQALAAIEVLGIIAAPLYVEGRLWGVMSVEQCLKPRKWTENEKNFVAITASTIAGIIMRDIYNNMLKDALHKATEASKAKSEFLSNMSHEMRTPLNAITGMTSIGRNAKDTERKDYALDKIEDASTHLLGVINDVLDMSKIEANMLVLSPIEFNFEKMLKKAVAVVNFRVDEKKQKLLIHIDKEIPRMLIADDHRLTQVITNLLSNAVKFTPEKGSITLEVRCTEEKDGYCTMQISVTDTGIGISKDQQKHLFSSFQQAESSTTRKYGGTGLGLAISKSIVELMGGKIWVDSEPGKGSTFAFTIRAMCGTEEKQKRMLDVNLRDVRIMVVDDDPDILAYFSDLAHEIGVLCETAGSGEEALTLIKQRGGCHIYFVDWKMPGMDGIQLSREIKTNKQDNSVVVMISAAEWSAIADGAKDAGVDKFMSKPLFQSTIAEIINECISNDDKQQPEKTEPGTVDITGIFAGKKILLVEDVEINREIVQALLEPTQLEIDCAENGAEAVRMFTETPQKYDIIFMDIQMPEMDGYEATRRIRVVETELCKTPKRIPIIAMTANVFREDIEKCLAAGMDSHVGKPLDFEEVITRLRLHLG